MRPLVAGNWKMNGLAGDLGELAVLRDALAKQVPSCDVLISPPATLMAQAAWAVKGAFALGGQDCHAERRHHHGESDSDVAAKARAAWRAGLKAIICIGETEAQRDAGHAHAICQGQLDASVPDGATPANTVLAYEPVWAIGTGRTPTQAEIAAMHAHIRSCLLRRLGPSA